MALKVVATAAEQAEQLRLDGNSYFKKERFGAAIDAYTEAIVLCPNVSVYWTNRALCHLKRNDWTRLEEDCRKAIQLDHHSVKACYMLGLALLQRKEYAEGVKQLEKALDLGRGADPKGYMVEEIWQELARAKYLAWEDESTKRCWELQNLKEACAEALKEKHLPDASQNEGFEDENAESNLEQLEALGKVFNKAAEDDTPTEVPDYLCCKITLDIFRDPVIAPSGFTYERAVILDHLEKLQVEANTTWRWKGGAGAPTYVRKRKFRSSECSKRQGGKVNFQDILKQKYQRIDSLQRKDKWIPRVMRKTRAKKVPLEWSIPPPGGGKTYSSHLHAPAAKIMYNTLWLFYFIILLSSVDWILHNSRTT